MKRPWLAAVLNFFFPGAGVIYNGRRTILGVVWLVAVLSLTYVEQTLKTLSDPSAPGLYWLMFATVFVSNTAWAVDGWQEAQRINAEKSPAPAPAAAAA